MAYGISSSFHSQNNDKIFAKKSMHVPHDYSIFTVQDRVYEHGERDISPRIKKFCACRGTRLEHANLCVKVALYLSLILQGRTIPLGRETTGVTFGGRGPLGGENAASEPVDDDATGVLRVDLGGDGAPYPLAPP